MVGAEYALVIFFSNYLCIVVLGFFALMVMIKKKFKKRNRPKLTLIQGGKSERGIYGRIQNNKCMGQAV